MSKGKILFQLTGSIAGFKACQLLSTLVKDGYEVEVVASRAALHFVGEATLEGLSGRKVHVDTFASGDAMAHIHLARWSDLILLCPATANVLNKLAAGIADDLISTLFLAHDFTKPYLIAPAMNEKMLWHPATRASIDRLREWGLTVLESGRGYLACGESGEGRLLEPDVLFSEIENRLAPKTAHPKRVLVTAGGTREPIDGVRAITNFSSGRTGVGIAERFARDGHHVLLVRAVDAEKASRAYDRLQERTFATFADLRRVLRDELGKVDYDMVVHAAAVSDFSVDSIQAGDIELAAGQAKIDSSESLLLRLKRNPKIVDELRSYSRHQGVTIVAFKLTNRANAEERFLAVHKLAAHARPDFIVQNDLSEIDPATGRHACRIYAALDPSTLHEVAAPDTKEKLARELELILESAHGRRPAVPDAAIESSKEERLSL